MLRRSLTAKVLLAVGVTVAVVIAIYTYFVIRVQTVWWHERTQAQNVIATAMIHEYMNGVMLSDRHAEVQNFLLKLQKSDEISRGRIITTTGRIMFSTETQEVGQVASNTPRELFETDQVLQGVRVVTGQKFATAMRPVSNSANCQKCHETRQPFLGAIITERSLAPADANIATNRNLLIVYGALIFALVGVVIWLLIVRLVSQPVRELLAQMRRVERGDLTAYAEAQRPDEIGELARDFNAMVRSLQSAKAELHESHAKQMQQASKLATIGELAAGIAHEIRNPLAGIGAAVEVLAENRSPQEREIVSEIRRQITRLNNTLRDLLDFSRQREPEVASCEVGELIRPMLALVRPDAQKHRVQIVEDVPADLPALEVDAAQIQQAVLNILLNAIQAMPAGGMLTVGARASRPVSFPVRDGRDARVTETVGITISDTGVGISEENLAKIFSPFFTTKHQGTGLGLAITRSVVEKNQGVITVTSTVGAGTTFVLEFAIVDVVAAVPGGIRAESTAAGTAAATPEKELSTYA